MASTESYFEFIRDMLSGIDDISFRKMMGEYIVYCRGKIVGGIYDDRFLVKPTKSARDLMPEAAEETPYEGAKKMLLVDNVEDREFLGELIEAVCAELPEARMAK
jgi:TfoX/Sxy family transcriptional regulator of competence genes